MISLGRVYLRRKFAFSGHLKELDERSSKQEWRNKLPRNRGRFFRSRSHDYTGDAYLTDEDQANLITSELFDDHLDDFDKPFHALTLDIDHPTLLIQSRTSDHYHLYIDHPMPWLDYVDVLTVLGRVGVLEQGYVDASINQGRTALRKARWDLHWGKIRDALSDLEEV